ncbi:MAG: membrane protein insertase YidC [Gammaproteobacteria bacterium]|nr:membrane protein insertase YidC [Gammaproteobacteria bacterium]
MGNPRLVLLAALGFIMMLMWQEWQKDYGPKPAQQTVASTQQNQQGMLPVADQQPTTQSEELPELSTSSSLNQASEQPQEDSGDQTTTDVTDRYVHVLTDKLDVWIDTRGGEISRLSLRAYPVALDKPEDPFPLLVKNQAEVYTAQSGLLSRQGAPNHLAQFTVSQSKYQLSEGEDTLRVPLFWKNEQGIKVTKTLIFNRGTHVIDVEQKVDNQSSLSWQGNQYRQLVRTRPLESGGMADTMAYTFNGAAYYSEEDKFEKIDFDDIEDEPLTRDVAGGWVGMIQHYFLSAWIPGQDETNNFYTKMVKGGMYRIGMISAKVLVQPGESTTFSSRFYAGPKEQQVLEELSTGLRLSVDYSWLTIIAQPIFWLMTFIHDHVIDNWGWSIILLTLIIKLLFYKLSEYGYRSMANMRRVQPKLVSLKERYGSDKQKMQQAMMELYRKEKINPMSGCFPILLQIPVFIALYWVLLESVELRQAPFMLWIHDLSVADPYFVLPLIMGASMFLQQKLNPAPMDEMQKNIMKFLPIVFTVFFLFFPAGLVLYWVVNNILSIAQQWVITRRIEAGTGKS